MEKIDQKLFETIAQNLSAKAEEIRWKKGKDYSEEDDRLANFRRLAERLGIHPRMVWAVFFMKQVDAVMTWAKEGSVASESIEDRFADIINYCHLGWAIEKACEVERVGAEFDAAMPKVDLPTILCNVCKQRYKITGQDPFCPHKEPYNEC